MKLYSYSSELLTYVEAKWAKAKLATVGMLIGGIIFIGFIKLNQSVANANGSLTANALEAENDFLRQQISLISPRVNELDMQAKELIERDNKLHILLHRRTIVGDSLSRFTYSTKGANL